MPDLDMVWMPIGNLRPHPDNARLGDTDLLMESLRVHGQYKPVVVASDGVVIAGNHLYAAAMELGWLAMRAVVVPFPSDDPRAIKIMLVDNRSTDISTYERADLVRLLKYLDDDYLATGYTSTSLDDLLSLIDDDANRDLRIEDPHESLHDRVDRYEQAGRRVLLLDYGQEEYKRVVGQLQTLRSRTGEESNAQLVANLLEETLGGTL